MNPPISHLPLTETLAESPPVDRIIYVNGINTCFEKALCSAKVLRHKLKVPITLAYNEALSPPYDFFNALIELIGGEETISVYEWNYAGTMPGSTPGHRQELYTTAYSQNNIFTNLICEIINGLTKGERLGLLGHSEGTAIINEAIAGIIKARTGEILLLDMNGNPIPRNVLLSCDLAAIHIVLAGGQEASERYSNVVGSYWQIVHHQDAVPWAFGPQVVDPNEDVPAWAFQGIYGWALPEEVLKYEYAPIHPWKYHDFLLVYLPYINLSSFTKTGMPLELTHEPPDASQSPCPSCR